MTVSKNTLFDIINSLKYSKETISFINTNTNITCVTYSELYKKSISRLEYLRQSRKTRISKAIIYLNDMEDFLVSFWACILGGIIPVPLSVDFRNDGIHRLLSIIDILEDPTIILNTRGLAFITKQSEKLGCNVDSYFNIDDYCETYLTNVAVSPNLNSSDCAYIQFTSGSTGNPKGVVLTNENLLSNISAIKKRISLGNGDVALSWLPLSHDMGLIGFHLTLAHSGLTHYLMAPFLFATKPIYWLELISKLKINIISSPNFGLKHVLKSLKWKTIESLDLSSVRIMFNGAEPISKGLCDKFIEAFHPYGLKKNVIYPVYGLAEASLAVAFPTINSEITSFSVNRKSLSFGEKVVPLSSESQHSVDMVSVGRAIEFCSVRIVDDVDKTLPDGVVGHIQITGKNVTDGYYVDPDATKKVFSGEWLKTGDLGFFNDGHLYISGRLKEVFVQNGINYYLHDLDRVINARPEFENVELAFCCVQDSSDFEKLILFIERSTSDAYSSDVFNQLNNILYTHSGVKLSNVFFIRKIPKTTSGKIQRTKLLSIYNNSEGALV